MNWPEAVRDITHRLDRLARESVRYRLGVVTATSPLSVALGGSDVPHTDVRCLHGVSLAVGTAVAVLTWKGGLLVLGPVADDPGPRAASSITLAANTTYQVTGARPRLIIVSASIITRNGGEGSAVLRVGSTSGGLADVSRAQLYNNNSESVRTYTPLSAIVPAGHYYRVATTSSGVDTTIGLSGALAQTL